MPVYVGFVRAVMLGRDGLHRDVLLDIVERSGGRDATSYLTTGNVSFSCAEDELVEVVERIEAGVEQVVERPTPVIVRSLEHLLALVERDPFADEQHPATRAQLVAMVRHRVRGDLDVPIESPNGDYRVFAVDGGDVFSITIDTGGRVQDPGGLIERLAGEPVTSRAFGTIEKIVAKLAVAQ